MRTTLTSSSPTHLTPGTVRQSQAGRRMAPSARRISGWRTKVPASPIIVSGADQVRPSSLERRRRTTAVSWLPDFCDV